MTGSFDKKILTYTHLKDNKNEMLFYVALHEKIKGGCSYEMRPFSDILKVPPVACDNKREAVVALKQVRESNDFWLGFVLNNLGATVKEVKKELDIRDVFVVAEPG